MASSKGLAYQAKQKPGGPDMARVRSKKVKKAKERQRQARRKVERKTRRKQRKQQRRMRRVSIGRAARNPKASPRARGCLAVHFW